MQESNKEKPVMPLLMPYEPEEFWQMLRQIIKEEIISAAAVNTTTNFNTPGLTYKPLHKIEEICKIFMITKPTVYEWIKLDILKPLKVHSRVYFLWNDIEELIKSNAAKNRG